MLRTIVVTARLPYPYHLAKRTYTRLTRRHTDSAIGRSRHEHHDTNARADRHG
jgi:hypothetical protein